MANPIIDALLFKLNATELQKQNQKLYDFLKDLISTDRANAAAISGIIAGTTPVPTITLDQEFLTASDETASLPNSRELLAGSGITFDDSVANERTINADVTADYVVAGNGVQPPTPIDDGAGNFVYVVYTP